MVFSHVALRFQPQAWWLKDSPCLVGYMYLAARRHVADVMAIPQVHTDHPLTNSWNSASKGVFRGGSNPSPIRITTRIDNTPHTHTHFHTCTKQQRKLQTSTNQASTIKTECDLGKMGQMKVGMLSCPHKNKTKAKQTPKEKSDVIHLYLRLNQASGFEPSVVNE